METSSRLNHAYINLSHRQFQSDLYPLKWEFCNKWNPSGKAQAAVTLLSLDLSHVTVKSARLRCFAPFNLKSGGTYQGKLLSQRVKSVRLESDNRVNSRKNFLWTAPEFFHTNEPLFFHAVTAIRYPPGRIFARDQIWHIDNSGRRQVGTRSAPGATTSPPTRYDTDESRRKGERQPAGEQQDSLARDKNVGRTCDNRIYVRLAESQSRLPS